MPNIATLDYNVLILLLAAKDVAEQKAAKIQNPGPRPNAKPEDLLNLVMTAQPLTENDHHSGTQKQDECKRKNTSRHIVVGGMPYGMSGSFAEFLFLRILDRRMQEHADGQSTLPVS